MTDTRTPAHLGGQLMAQADQLAAEARRQRDQQAERLAARGHRLAREAGQLLPTAAARELLRQARELLVTCEDRLRR